MAKNEESITIDGVKIYDPRLKKFVSSSNPALIMGDIARNVEFIPNWDTAIYDGNPFWDYISRMADVCDGNDFSIHGDKPYQTVNVHLSIDGMISSDNLRRIIEDYVIPEIDKRT